MHFAWSSLWPRVSTPAAAAAAAALRATHYTVLFLCVLAERGSTVHVCISIVTAACAAVSSAEDPEKILDQAVQDMNGDLIKLRQATAKARLAT